MNGEAPSSQAPVGNFQTKKPAKPYVTGNRSSQTRSSQKAWEFLKKSLKRPPYKGFRGAHEKLPNFHIYIGKKLGTSLYKGDL